MARKSARPTPEGRPARRLRRTGPNPFVWLGAASGLSLALLVGWGVLGPNVRLPETGYLYIRDGSRFGDVQDSLARHQVLHSGLAFRWLAQLVGYPQQVRPGRYALEPGMSTWRLVRNLAGGRQSPVEVHFGPQRSAPDVARMLTRRLQLPARQVLAWQTDTAWLHSLGLSPEHFLLLFVPNTYEVYWNVTEPKLKARLEREYRRFWTEERRRKARQLNLSPAEVGILASIVEEETQQNAEKPRIAGVYLNRLNEGWKLQADPTVKAALNNWSLRRVLKRHTETDSPMNTYRYKGLPPAPLNCPSPASIDAVLNAERHDYFYFVASLQRPGFHDFSTEDEYDRHVELAKSYRENLNRRGINR